MIHGQSGAVFSEQTLGLLSSLFERTVPDCRFLDICAAFQADFYFFI